MNNQLKALMSDNDLSPDDIKILLSDYDISIWTIRSWLKPSGSSNFKLLRPMVFDVIKGKLKGVL